MKKNSKFIRTKKKAKKISEKNKVKLESESAKEIKELGEHKFDVVKKLKNDDNQKVIEKTVEEQKVTAMDKDEDVISNKSDKLKELENKFKAKSEEVKLYGRY